MAKRVYKDGKKIWEEIWSKKAQNEAMAPYRVKLALDLLGSPQSLFSLALSWGQGKESSSRLLDSLLQSYGLSSGLFCPQANDLESCLKVRGKSLSAKRLSDLYKELENFLALSEERFEKEGMGEMGPMEVLVCLAALAFSDEPVDAAVFEVPEGDFEDIFAVLSPSLLLLTPDPSRPLPLGFIGPSSFVASCSQGEEAMESLKESVQDQGACLVADGKEMRVENDLLAVGGQVADLFTPRGSYLQVPIKLFGEFQAHFALLSLAAGERLLSEAKLEDELVGEAFSTANVPGSLKVIKPDPLTFSASPDSPFKTDLCLSALKETFHPSFLAVVLAPDKRFDPNSLSVWERSCDLLITAHAPEGKMSAEDLFSMAEAHFDSGRLLCIPDFSMALKRAREIASREGGCALVTGGLQACLKAERELR